MQIASRGTLDLLCQIACEYLNNGNQSCVEEQVRALPSTTTDGLFPEVTFYNTGEMYRNGDGSPQTRYGVPGSRLDITRVESGALTEFIEMKFPGDRMRGSEEARYQRIARANGTRLQPMTIPSDCNNCEGERQEESQGQSYVVPALLGTAALIGIGICIWGTAGFCGLAVAGGGLAAAS